ncbi:MAG: acetyl-CoA C-acetyltransferase [Lewinella sp.]|jgi:acetyl-CoA C-acetyltransferase|uniref:acetyl-CoA C-acetyltransferase n=1 Tax=Lewinella sp. TaxID=2004506 RepID=UPI003D6AFBCA
MKDVFIYDALRTPRAHGKARGALYEVKPVHLLEVALRALQRRHQFQASDVDDLIIGCVTPIGDQGFNIARTALLEAGMSAANGGMQINRYCTSGLEAVNLAAAKIAAGWEELSIAGGTESMSRVPMGSDGGPLLNDPGVFMTQNYLPQGVAADLIATMEGFQREELDAYAVQSHQRAAAAQTAGYFQPSIVPICDANGLAILKQDETIRPETNLEQLSRLRPSFARLGDQGFAAMALHRYPEVEKVHYLHTPGNSCSLSDGAALVLLGNEAKGKALGLKPRARILSCATVAVDPTIMLTGPGLASEKALKISKLKPKDIDLWECNEAFAAVVLKFQRDLNLNDDQLNVNGGAIALGHPLGATGAMLLGTMLDELERRDLKTGLVTLCAGAGLAVATIIERV